MVHHTRSLKPNKHGNACGRTFAKIVASRPARDGTRVHYGVVDEELDERSLTNFSAALNHGGQNRASFYSDS